MFGGDSLRRWQFVRDCVWEGLTPSLAVCDGLTPSLAVYEGLCL